MITKNKNNSKVWIYKETITCFDKFYIQDLEILKCKWIYLDEIVTIKHPKYNQEYNEHVLSIIEKDIQIYFLAVEFSNNVWGIYLKDDYETKLIKFKS